MIRVLDLVREESSLEARHRELGLKIAEGRQVIDALALRRTAIDRKIEEASRGLQRLEQQREAVETVVNMVAEADIQFQPPRPVAPVLEVVTSTASSAPVASPSAPERFKLRVFMKCVTTEGHDFVVSRSMPGHLTCRRCRVRRRR